MVGVPGRSKGCLTCRKRKKGCDQQRPACGQCRRASVVCQGYPADLTFVRYKPNKDDGRLSTEITEKGRGPVPLTRDEPDSLVSAARSADSRLLNSGVDLFMFDSYWHLFFPRAKVEERVWVPNGERLATVVPSSWAMEMRDHYESDLMVRTGMQATAYAMVAKHVHDPRLNVASMQAYSIVLREISRALEDKEMAISDSTLTACKLLAIYEAHQGAAHNWGRHSAGILRLVELRGPEAHQEGLNHSMFLDVRYQSCVMAITRRKPCFLRQKEWCTVPFAIVGKTYRDEMIDVLANIPRITHAYDQLKLKITSEGSITSDQRHYFFEVARSLNRALDAWFERLKMRFDLDLITRIHFGVPESFPLSSILLAHTMTVYWASRLFVNNTVMLGLQTFPPGRGVDDLGQDVSTLQVMPYILYIAKSIPYFFQPDGGAICPQAFSFPLGAALHIAAHRNALQVPEYRRLLKAFTKGAMGAQIRRFMSGFLDLTELDSYADEEEDTVIPQDALDTAGHSAKDYWENGRTMFLNKAELSKKIGSAVYSKQVADMIPSQQTTLTTKEFWEDGKTVTWE